MKHKTNTNINTNYNSSFNAELYKEMQADEGCIYDEEIKEEVFENMMCDYL